MPMHPGRLYHNTFGSVPGEPKGVERPERRTIMTHGKRGSRLPMAKGARNMHEPGRVHARRKPTKGVQRGG